MQSFLIKSIHIYRRLLSPVIGQQCRFTPTCSRYAEQAIELYGPGRGSWLAARRILRCHPLCEGGDDPVPGNEDVRQTDLHDDWHDDGHDNAHDNNHVSEIDRRRANEPRA